MNVIWYTEPLFSEGEIILHVFVEIIRFDFLHFKIMTGGIFVKSVLLHHYVDFKHFQIFLVFSCSVWIQNTLGRVSESERRDHSKEIRETKKRTYLTYASNNLGQDDYSIRILWFIDFSMVQFLEQDKTSGFVSVLV